MRMIIKGLIKNITFKIIPAEGYSPILMMLPFFIHLLIEQHLRIFTVHPTLCWSSDEQNTKGQSPSKQRDAMTISDHVTSCERDKTVGNKNLLQKVSVESMASLRCKHCIRMRVLLLGELTLPGLSRLQTAAEHVEWTLLCCDYCLMPQWFSFLLGSWCTLSSYK